MEISPDHTATVHSLVNPENAAGLVKILVPLNFGLSKFLNTQFFSMTSCFTLLVFHGGYLFWQYLIS